MSVLRIYQAKNIGDRIFYKVYMESNLYRKTCVCVCVSRMDGQTACTIWTKFSELIAIYPTGNIGGSVCAPLSNKGSLSDGGT